MFVSVFLACKKLWVKRAAGKFSPTCGFVLWDHGEIAWFGPRMKRKQTKKGFIFRCHATFGFQFHFLMSRSVTPRVGTSQLMNIRFHFIRLKCNNKHFNQPKSASFNHSLGSSARNMGELCGPAVRDTKIYGWGDEIFLWAWTFGSSQKVWARYSSPACCLMVKTSCLIRTSSN